MPASLEAMAVPLRIIRLTMAIDEGDHRAYEQLKALARTDPDARRVLGTVKEPPRPAAPVVKRPPEAKAETPEQTAERARTGDGDAIAKLRKRAEYEDTAAQSALGLALLRTDPDEARKWLIRSSRVPESMAALRRMASSGDTEAARFVKEQEAPKPKRVRGEPEDAPVRDDLGYYKPPTKHTTPRIGDVYRLNDAKLGTGQTNSMVLIKEKRGDFVTAWTVTREPGRHKAVRLIEPSLAGFASPAVYVLTDTDRVFRKDSLAEYRGTLGPKDIKQFRLSARDMPPARPKHPRRNLYKDATLRRA